MSRLRLNQRPFVIFDATNPEHRSAAKEFFRTGSWKNCQWQFFIADDSNDLPYFLSKELLNYYFEHDQPEGILKKVARVIGQKKR